jgi:ribosomal protein S21
MHIALRDGESQEALLARFQKAVQRSGILREARAHRFFVPKPEQARIAARKAARKAARRAARAAARAAHSRSPR